MSEAPRQAARRLAESAIAQGYEPAALHVYRDATGEPLYWRIRARRADGDKWIRPMRRNGDGYELAEPEPGPAGKPLYLLDRIAQADTDAIVIVVEGELCADALAQAGIVATTSGSATSASAADWGPLSSRRVIIWPDLDEPGAHYALEVAERLAGIAERVEIIDIRDLGLEEHGDAVDWLRAHPDATADEVLALPRVEAPSPPRAVADGADTAAIARLAALDPIAYDRARESEAEALGIRVSTLDTEVARMRRSEAPDAAQGHAVKLPEPDPWPEPVDGAALLEELNATVRRHLVMTAAGSDAVALWVLHAHAHDASGISPILAVTSPTPECGKTTLQTLLGALVPRPLLAANITTAALFRAVERWGPTLLIDEADTFLRDSDDLRGVLNSGHARASAWVVRTVGDDHEPRQFATWSPKAIALIGRLPATLTSRSIPIELRRMAPAETVAPLRADRLGHLEPLARRAARWTADSIDVLREADPDMPAGLRGRAADNWRPLLAIADQAGGDWPARARQAAEALTAGSSEQTAGIMLLEDVRAILAAQGADRIASADLAASLAELETRPWPEWGRSSKPITPRQIARLLEPFGIRPRQLRLPDGRTGISGYRVEELGDAFARYLPPDRSSTPLQASNGAGSGRSDPLHDPADVEDAIGEIPSIGAGCRGVEDEIPPTRRRETL